MQWKCDETGVTENLWLNLGTGHIGSGRPQWDGTGGNGSALRHYEETGKKYPLVVKLGTITPAGADVYSYASDEDDMVLDPQLGNHLAHWGINMMKMEKTEKSMTELQIERNINFEFDTITESGAALIPLSGKGFVFVFEDFFCSEIGASGSLFAFFAVAGLWDSIIWETVAISIASCN